jgi:hypothetical protein
MCVPRERGMTEHVQSQKGTISLVFYSPRKRATAPGVNQSKERNMSMSNGNSYSGTMRVTIPEKMLAHDKKERLYKSP